MEVGIIVSSLKQVKVQNTINKYTITLAVAVAAFLLLTPVTGLAQIGCWHMDEASGTTIADACGSSSGNLSNGPVWLAGVTGSALAFDGTNEFVRLSQPVIGHNANFTIEAWVKFSASGQATQTIYSESTSGSEEIALRIVKSSSSSGNLQSYTSRNAQSVTSPVLLPAGAWHFVAATVKWGFGTVLYVDGVATITNATAGAFNNAPNLVSIGASRNIRDGSS